MHFVAFPGEEEEAHPTDFTSALPDKEEVVKISDIAAFPTQKKPPKCFVEHLILYAQSGFGQAAKMGMQIGLRPIGEGLREEKNLGLTHRCAARTTKQKETLAGLS